jgi:2-(1,2-epoxy-1,2-dihydrophenyl)acetyl-CoA isomerase
VTQVDSATQPNELKFETVKFEFREKVAIVTMNRPEALNALSQQLTRELASAFQKAFDEKARAILFTGEGRAFCSGGDLREMKKIADVGGKIEAFFEEPLKDLHGVIRIIREAAVPFVAGVNGVCAGAGTNFALACDVVFASENASFNEGFIKIGLSPDCGGSFFLPRAIGEKLAAELLMTGDSVDANRACEIGMINRVVAPEKLFEESFAMAQRLSEMPTGSIARIKRMLNSSYLNDLNAQLELEHQCQIESGRSNDFKEGVAAFFEKRRPNFSGT